MMENREEYLRPIVQLQELQEKNLDEFQFTQLMQDQQKSIEDKPLNLRFCHIREVNEKQKSSLNFKQFFNLNMLCYFFVVQEFLRWMLHCTKVCLHIFRHWRLNKLLLTIVNCHSLSIRFFVQLIMIFIIRLNLLLKAILLINVFFLSLLLRRNC